MKALYDHLSIQVCKMTTRMYSTSFSLGIYFLNKTIRNGIYSVYGFVRLADEIVDSFDGYDRRQLLEKFKQETYEALRCRISVNPILHSFQEAFHRYHIRLELVDVFFESMEMDLDKVCYDSEKYKKYILGSAEVVGLMCLHVFTEGHANLYQELEPYAMKLGAAFQKVNFLRDMKDDYQLLGRVYFPDVNMSTFTEQAKEKIEAEIENDFGIALVGIRKLPPSSKGGVYLAYVYYQSLFAKIKRLTPDRILTGRIRISNGKKIRLMVNSLLECKMRMV